MLDGQEVDAIVYDRPQLMYYINMQKDNDVELAKAAHYQKGYIFAFPEESNLIFKVNRTLLELAEDDQIAEIPKNIWVKSIKKFPVKRTFLINLF